MHPHWSIRYERILITADAHGVIPATGLRGGEGVDFGVREVLGHPDIGLNIDVPWTSAQYISKGEMAEATDQKRDPESVARIRERYWPVTPIQEPTSTSLDLKHQMFLASPTVTFFIKHGGTNVSDLIPKWYIFPNLGLLFDGRLSTKGRKLLSKMPITPKELIWTKRRRFILPTTLTMTDCSVMFGVE